MPNVAKSARPYSLLYAVQHASNLLAVAKQCMQVLTVHGITHGGHETCLAEQEGCRQPSAVEVHQTGSNGTASWRLQCAAWVCFTDPQAVRPWLVQLATQTCELAAGAVPTQVHKPNTEALICLNDRRSIGLLHESKTVPCGWCQYAPPADGIMEASARTCVHRTVITVLMTVWPACNLCCGAFLRLSS